MSRFLPLVFAFFLPLALFGVTKKPVKNPVSKAAPVKGKAKGAGHGKASLVRGKKGKRGTTAAHTAPVERSQAAPSSDRFREIQQALVTKGYLKSEPSGIWDADSQDAMRRYQSDQKLDQTGKINSLSLISLGLGPNHQ